MTKDHDQIMTLEERTKQMCDKYNTIKNLLIGVFISIFGLIGSMVFYGGKIVANQYIIKDSQSKLVTQQDADYDALTNQADHKVLLAGQDTIIKNLEQLKKEHNERLIKLEQKLNCTRGINPDTFYKYMKKTTVKNNY